MIGRCKRVSGQVEANAIALSFIFLIALIIVSESIGPVAMQAGNVVINEFLPMPTGDWDDDGEFDPNGDEFIELYNPTSTNIDLSGWVLDDIEGGSAPYKIPKGTHILAKGFLVYFGSTTGIRLNNDGDTVRLINIQGTLVDSRSYTSTQGNVSYVRVPDGGEWSTSTEPTPAVSLPFHKAAEDYVLRGRVVTMESESSIIKDGYVLIEGNLVKAVWDVTANPPVGVSLGNLEVIETGGLIFPGLIDLHNHIAYNILPIWKVPQMYTNRYQWTRPNSYKTEVSWPKELLTGSSYANLEAEVVKYAEVKALVGGATSIQGSPGQRTSFGNILVRNVELQNFGVDKVYQYVMPVSGAKETYFLKLIADGMVDAIFFHVAEGTDAPSRAEFTTLKAKGLVVEELVIIHGTALSQEDFSLMGSVGAKLVWSPLSNLLFYGNTTNVVAAWSNGVTVSLAPDWSPSGSKNVLGELKIASQWNMLKLGHFFSDYQLVQMVTTNPAKTLNWSHLVGRVKAGLHADLLVIKDPGGDPYGALIRATDEDVLLVAVDGDALYGRWDWLERLKPGDWEVVECPGLVRGLDVTFPDAPKGAETWAEIVSNISDAMNFDPWIGNSSYPGLHAIPLTPLFASCDPEFFGALNTSTNAMLPFNLWDEYYAGKEVDTDGDGIPDSADSDDDNDGLGDIQEDQLRTDPLSPDTDRDRRIDSQDFYPLDATRWQRGDDLMPYTVAGGVLAAIIAGGYYYSRRRRR